MALVSDIQLQSSAVKPPNLDTSQKFSAEGLTATTAFSVTDAGAGTTVTPLGLMTAQSANDISAYFNTTNTDGDINLYLNNDANPYWNLKLSGTASDSFMITNACGGPAGGTAAEKTALSITPVGAVGIGKASASNALDISYQNSSSGGVVITEATNSIATKIISESSSGSIGTTTNSKFGFRTNSATVGAFDTSGNFGIGTDAPGALLDVRGSAIFNEAGAAVDFRIEGDTCANLFFVDGSTDRIGIGTATPAVLLDVDNGGATSQILMCVNGCICAQGYLGEAAGHTIEDAGTAETQRTGLNFVLTNVGCVVDDSSNDATVVCINGANTCVPFLMCDGTTSDPISLAGGSIGNQVANDGSPCLGGTLNGCDENVCCICCLAIKGCYFGDGSQLTGVSSVPSSFSGDCTIIGCSAGGNVAAGGAKIVLIGGNAGYNATTPSNIVVMGSSAGLCMTTATDTVLIGTGSGRCVLTCAGNLALGAWSLYNECAGSFNTALGTCAGLTQKGATTNTFVGAYAGTAVTTGSGNVFVGYKAGCASTASCCLIIGNGTCDLITGDFNGGKVGIGTTTPDRTLTVDGSIGVKTTSATGSPQIAFRQATTDKAYFSYWDASDTLALTNGAAAGLHFDPTNVRVGIGTAAPASLLHLYTTTAAPTALTISNSNADANSAYLKFQKISASPADNDMAGLIDFYVENDNNEDVRSALIYSQMIDVSDGTEDGNLVFKTTVAGSLHTSMTIREGKVGIATGAAPDKELDVFGTAAFGNGTGYIYVGNSGMSLSFNRDPTDGSISNSSAHAYQFQQTTSATPASDYLAVQVYDEGGTEVSANAFVINGAGNIGIGTATPGYLWDTFACNATYAAKIQNVTGGDGLYIKAGGSSSEFALAVNNFDDSVGILSVKADGNVGIGTAAPGNKLSVEGSSTAAFNPDSTVGDFNIRNRATDTDQQFAGLSMVVGNGSGDGSARIDTIHNGTGTAADLAFSTSCSNASLYEHMRITESGKVGIATATPAAKLHVMQTTAGTYAARFENNQLDGPTVWINHTGTTSATNPVLAVAGAGVDALQVKSNGGFFLSRQGTGSGASDTGWYMVGAGGQLYGASASAVMYLSKSNTGTIQGFRYNDTYVGQVDISSSATAYQSASDYRLKENIVDLINATDRVAQLKPRRFNWKVDPDVITDGFIAHEVDSIVPEAVSGTKDERCIVENVILAADGTKIEKNVSEALWQDGKTDGKYPIDSTWKASHEVDWYQSMDNAKLVPVLTAAVQELTVRLEAAETKITILEAA